jgi:hypothetical protein
MRSGLLYKVNFYEFFMNIDKAIKELKNDKNIRFSRWFSKFFNH